MGLGIAVVEHLPTPQAARPGRGANKEPAPPPPERPLVLDDDVLILRLGGVAPAAPRERAPAGKPAAPAPQPGSGKTAAPPPARDTYVVQKGDTLSEIARRELGSARFADELARLNGLKDPGALRVGQVLKLR